MTTTTRPSAPDSLARWLPVGAVIVVVLGVLGMHGLALHGTGMTSHAGLAVPITEQLDAGSHHAPVAGSTAAEPEHAAMNSGGDESGGHDMGMVMVGMCIAALVGLGLVVLLFLTRAGERRPWWSVPSSPLRVAYPASACAHDPPPDIHKLSLLRC